MRPPLPEHYGMSVPPSTPLGKHRPGRIGPRRDHKAGLVGPAVLCGTGSISLVSIARPRMSKMQLPALTFQLKLDALAQRKSDLQLTLHGVTVP